MQILIQPSPWSAHEHSGPRPEHFQPAQPMANPAHVPARTLAGRLMTSPTHIQPTAIPWQLMSIPMDSRAKGFPSQWPEGAVATAVNGDPSKWSAHGEPLHDHPIPWPCHAISSLAPGSTTYGQSGTCAAMASAWQVHAWPEYGQTSPS
jgi:hypothetical protein